MTPTRVRTLLVIGVACAAVAWLAVRSAFATLPPLPWSAVPALVLLAAAELAIARSLVARRAGRGKPAAPMAVARIAALAKASSAVAAVFGGLAAGAGLYAAGQFAKQVPRHDAVAALATLAGAVALTAAALYLEHCCRAPGSGDEPPGAPQRDWRSR